MNVYKHKSGLEFDLGLINGHDLTAILLYAMPDDDELMDDHVWLVDYLWGCPSDCLPSDLDYAIDNWLATMPADFVSTAIRRQAKYGK